MQESCKESISGTQRVVVGSTCVIAGLKGRADAGAKIKRKVRAVTRVLEYLEHVVKLVDIWLGILRDSG